MRLEAAVAVVVAGDGDDVDAGADVAGDEMVANVPVLPVDALNLRQ